jgi:excinuclease UvrABC nuclease subunit
MFDFYYPAFCMSAKFREILPNLQQAYSESVVPVFRKATYLPGVYAFFDAAGCVYAGRASQVALRIAQHVSSVRPSPWFARWVKSQATPTIELIVGVSILFDVDLVAEEHKLIGELRPRENRQ